MRRISLFRAAALALAAPMMTTAVDRASAEMAAQAPEVVRYRKVQLLPGNGKGRKTRSKGAQAHRARKPNRVRMGRRVRRKHRRAA